MSVGRKGRGVGDGGRSEFGVVLDAVEVVEPPRFDEESVISRGATADITIGEEPPADLVRIAIDGRNISVPKGTTILEAARRIGVEIPTLCYHPSVKPRGVCRICVVEEDKRGELIPACTFRVVDGMIVYTNTPRVVRSREMTLRLLMARHPLDCLVCIRNENCNLQGLVFQHGIRDRKFSHHLRGKKKDLSSSAIERNPDMCILCGLCVAACDEIQGVEAIRFAYRGYERIVQPPFDRGIGEVECVACGQCTLLCPVAAIYERDAVRDVQAALQEEGKFTVAQVSPSVGASIGEAFDSGGDGFLGGQLVASLRRLGFDCVFNMGVASDLMVMEMVEEFLERIRGDGPLPLVTASGAAWVKYVEDIRPEVIPHLSTCKSPQQILGNLTKGRYAKLNKMDVKDMVVVSIVPCTARKYEASRPEMKVKRRREVDYVLTTREVARLIKAAGMDLPRIAPEGFDPPFDLATADGALCCTSGGTCSAFLRALYRRKTGGELEEVEFREVPGFPSIKEASVDIDGDRIRVAVAHTLRNAPDVISLMNNYHFVEMMCCPDGCIGGGGQPIPTDADTRARRLEILGNGAEGFARATAEGKGSAERLHKSWIEHLSPRSKSRILHTTYTARGRYRSIGDPHGR
ncbi:MAG: [Fe-Fe] hydrogenase large subunit C-terminal domain-containing protein [bacterium]